MKINKIRLRNFLSFGNKTQEIECADVNTIVGPNDSGKTNIFRAIEFVGKILNGPRETLPLEFYHNQDYTHPFEIEINIEFNEEEKEVLSNFLVSSCVIDNVNVQKGEDQESARALIKTMILGNGTKLFSKLFNDFSIIVKSEKRTIYPADILFRFKEKEKELYYYSYRLTKKPSGRGSYTSYNMTKILLDYARSKHGKQVETYLKGNKKFSPKLREIPNSIFNHIYQILPEGKSDSIDIRGFRLDEGESRYENFNEIIRLREFLRKKGIEHTQGINLIEIIAIIFNSSIIKTADIRSRPKGFLEPNKTSEFPHMLNLNGENLISILFELRNSEIPEIKKRYHEIHKNFKELTKGLEFDIIIKERKFEKNVWGEVSTMPENEASIQTRKIVPIGIKQKKEDTYEYELIIQILKEGIPISSEYVSAGRLETLGFLTVIIGQTKKIILLDEPALNLHPILQKNFYELMLKSINKHDNQIIMITHSPYLIHSENLQKVWKLNATKKGTRTHSFKKILHGLNLKDEKKIIKEFHKSDLRNLLFQHGVIVVEGPSDKVVIEKFDSYYSGKKNTDSIEDMEWIVLEAGGKDSTLLIIKLLKKLQISFVCIYDYDTLMHCQKAIKINNKEIKTSSIIYYIHNSDKLSLQEIKILEKAEEKIKNIQITKNGKQFTESWYDKDLLSQLQKIALNHNMFVFTNDLEGITQTRITKKESKPLKAIERINEMIEENKFPSEFKQLHKFIHNKIKKSK